MPDDPKPTLAEMLRKTLPQAVTGDAETAKQLDAVAELERGYRELQQRSNAERAFLERAPREGLQYPADALKLVDLANVDEKAIGELYAKLHSERPYLFAARATSPGNEKLATGFPPEIERLRQNVSRAGATKDMQALRDAVLRRRKR
ncbi:MAG: hypothetical protein IT462_05775 [Planctomycetes bacterium]|nr:hypothetical protein [Planctomycetota bacterium]